ncbi:MAG TPA: TetR/AcrR family transcriptional regulator [bacterium]
MNSIERGNGTPERLLDAAEEIFAREGFRATTLRAVTARAGVNLAAANYHFGSKRELLQAVFERRMLPRNRARVARLRQLREAARGAGRRPEVRDIILTMMESVIGRERSEGRERFGAFIARSFLDPDPTVRTAFSAFMRPAFRATLDALAEALPGLPRRTLFWRLQFAIGAIARVNLLSHTDGKAMLDAPSPEPGALVDELAAFAAAGMAVAPATAPPRATRTRRKK